MFVIGNLVVGFLLKVEPLPQKRVMNHEEHEHIRVVKSSAEEFRTPDDLYRVGLGSRRGGALGL